MIKVTKKMVKKWLILGKSPIFRSRLGLVGMGACRYRLIKGKIFYTLPNRDGLHPSRYDLLHLSENHVLVLNPPEE